MVFFPDSLDFFSFSRTRLEHNSAAVNNRFGLDDMLYMLNELQKKVGANASDDSTSLDAKLRALESRLDETRSTLSLLTENLVRDWAHSSQHFPFRANRVAVTTSGTVVRFSTAIAAGYVLQAACFNAAGQLTGYTISNQTSEGFTVTPQEDGTLEWIAVPAL